MSCFGESKEAQDGFGKDINSPSCGRGGDTAETMKHEKTGCCGSSKGSVRAPCSTEARRNEGVGCRARSDGKAKQENTCAGGIPAGKGCCEKDVSVSEDACGQEEVGTSRNGSCSGETQMSCCEVVPKQLKTRSNPSRQRRGEQPEEYRPKLTADLCRCCVVTMLKSDSIAGALLFIRFLELN